MGRAFFLAMGIYSCILGAECMVVERFVMAGERPAVEASPGAATFFGGTTASTSVASRDFEPPEWAPWSLLSAGAVIILYAVTINRQG